VPSWRHLSVKDASAARLSRHGVILARFPPECGDFPPAAELVDDHPSARAAPGGAAVWFGDGESGRSRGRRRRHFVAALLSQAR
jgi:hypothetical protein